MVRAVDGSGVEGVPSSEVSASTLTTAAAPVRVHAGGGAYTTVTGAKFQADTVLHRRHRQRHDLLHNRDQDHERCTRALGPVQLCDPVPNGTYDVRLHFVELYYSTVVPGCAGKRIFGMDVREASVHPTISNLDICAQVGPRAPLMRTISNVNVTGGTLHPIPSTARSTSRDCCDRGHPGGGRSTDRDPDDPGQRGPASPPVSTRRPRSLRHGRHHHQRIELHADRLVRRGGVGVGQLRRSEPYGNAYADTGAVVQLERLHSIPHHGREGGRRHAAARDDDVDVHHHIHTRHHSAHNAREPPERAGGVTQVALTWNASTDNVGVVKYDVYRSGTSGFTPSASNRIAQVSAALISNLRVVGQGSQTDATPPNTHDYTFTGDVAAGDTVFVHHNSTIDAADGGIQSITDDAGNTYVKDVQAPNTNLGSASSTLEVWRSEVTHPITGGYTRIHILGYPRGLSSAIGMYAGIERRWRVRGRRNPRAAPTPCSTPPRARPQSPRRRRTR